jgi:hypothetical protein
VMLRLTSVQRRFGREGRDAEVSPSVVGGTVRCRDGRVNLWVDPGINPDSHPGADAPAGARRAAGGMNIYLINALLILLVVRQIREHRLDARALAVPVLAVAAAAVMFLHAVPSGGSDISWTWRACRPGRPWARSAAWPPGCAGAPTAGRWAGAGVLAAGMWITGVGARMVFYFAATHGTGRPSPPSASRTPSPGRRPGPRRWS